MKKICLTLLSCLLFLGSIYGTEGPEREITDVLIGNIDEDIIIYQYVYAYDGEHKAITERYILIKRIIDSKLVLIEQRVIEKDEQLYQYLSERHITILVPSTIDSKYYHLDIISKDEVQYLGTWFYLKTLLPNDLRAYDIDRIEDLYYVNDNVLIAIYLKNENGIESFRKIILLKPRKENG